MFGKALKSLLKNLFSGLWVLVLEIPGAKLEIGGGNIGTPPQDLMEKCFRGLPHLGLSVGRCTEKEQPDYSNQKNGFPGPDCFTLELLAIEAVSEKERKSQRSKIGVFVGSYDSSRPDDL